MMLRQFVVVSFWTVSCSTLALLPSAAAGAGNEDSSLSLLDGHAMSSFWDDVGSSSLLRGGGGRRRRLQMCWASFATLVTLPLTSPVTASNANAAPVQAGDLVFQCGPVGEDLYEDSPRLVYYRFVGDGNCYTFSTQGSINTATNTPLDTVLGVLPQAAGSCTMIDPCWVNDDVGELPGADIFADPGVVSSAASENDWSEVTLTTVAGLEYLIAVGGEETTDVGTISLNIQSSSVAACSAPPPTLAPTPAASPFLVCFPGQSHVALASSNNNQQQQQQPWKRLDEIVTGDVVRTLHHPSQELAAEVEVVYLPHATNHMPTTFLEFECTTTRSTTPRTKTLRATPHHFLFTLVATAKNGEDRHDPATEWEHQSVPAEHVQVGDYLWATTWTEDDNDDNSALATDPCRVHAIRSITDDDSGAYTAFTESGTLLVNGFVVSSYGQVETTSSSSWMMMTDHETTHETAAPLFQGLHRLGLADTPWVHHALDAAAEWMWTA